MPSPRQAGWVLLVASALALLLGRAERALRADDGRRQRVTQECTVLPTGDIRLVHTIRLPLAAYTALKDEVRNTALLLRRLGIGSQATLFADAHAAYDDEQSAVRVEARMVGGARSRGALWHVPIVNAREQEVLEQAPDRIRLLTIVELSDGTDQVVTTSLVFPPGTRGVRLDADAGRVEAQMPALAPKPGARPDLHPELEARKELMACFHKLYGLPEFAGLWVARVVIVNRGEGAARDLGVRFRIPGFAEWSPWETSGQVRPGQSVVEAYYPILGRAVLELTAETPAQLELEWRATGPDGEALGGQETRPLTLLGMNEVIWSSLPREETTSWAEAFDHSPLVAATFVSHTDPVVQRFAGMAAALSGGVAATRDDAHALRYMRAVYELMAANGIAYQSPPGLLKENLRQHVKFGRDVLRNRAGTCIDLAILFASTCQAGGLHPLLVFVPGHAFPAVKLPSGALRPLESTVINAGADGRPATFDEALQAGERAMDRALERGLYMLCDIPALRARGVPPPELPTLAGDPLAAWGIEAKGLTASGTPPGTKPPARPPPSAPAGTTWRHPDGAFSLTLPAGWQAKAEGDGADVRTHDRNVSASVRLVPRGELATARALAEDLGLRAVLGESGRAVGRKVLSHVEGQTGDKRHVRASLHCTHTLEERVMLEDFHVLLGRERGLVLHVQWPQAASEGWLPPLRAFVASLVFHDEPAPPAPPDVHRDPAGAYLLEVPAGWKAQVDAQGDLRLSLRYDAGAVLVRCLERHPEVTTAEKLAQDLATLFTESEVGKGAKVEVVARNRSLAGGAKIAMSSVLLRSTRADGSVQQREVEGFVGTRTMTLLAMDAPLALWPLWLPSFRQIFGSLKLDDTPLAGADATAGGRAEPAPPARPEVAPPAPRTPAPPAVPRTPAPPAEPPATPDPAALDALLVPYEDPAGLFTLHVPRGWTIEGQPLGVNASAPRGEAIVSFTLGARAGEDHDAYVARALAHLASSFARWKEETRALGGGGAERTTQLTTTAVVDGTPVHMLVDLTTTEHVHQLLLLVCPSAQRAAYAALWEAVLARYGESTAGWPGERPLPRLRAVAPERLPYALEVPTTWRVEPQGLDIVARPVHGDVLVVARAAPRAHESIDAFGAAILARMQARGRSVAVLAQEVREEGGRSVLVARLKDEVEGVAWEREVRALQTPTHDIQLVLAVRSDVRFKWERVLARIAASWQAR